MREIVSKGMRLRHPHHFKVSVRPCVCDWLEKVATDQGCCIEVLIRGIIEDYFDRFHISDREVTEE